MADGPGPNIVLMFDIRYGGKCLLLVLEVVLLPDDRLTGWVVWFFCLSIHYAAWYYVHYLSFPRGAPSRAELVRIL